MTYPDYARALMESSLPVKNELSRLVRTAVFPESQAATLQAASAGISRLGGLPDLPADIDWPISHGKPQSFVAQINLSELPIFRERNLLPERGVLFFFYDVEQSPSGLLASDRHSFAVRYSVLPGPVMDSHELPAGLDPQSVFKPARLSFRIGMSEPGWEHPILERLGLSFEERLRYADVVYRAEESAGLQTWPGFHRILGYPSPLQNTVAWDCECARVGYWEVEREKHKELQPAIREQVDEWELLLQVDCDPHAGIEWVGSGCLYYMIRREDLASRRFGEAWCILQTT